MEDLDEELAFREQINEAIAASSNLPNSKMAGVSWDPVDSEFLLAIKLQEMIEKQFQSTSETVSTSEWIDAVQDLAEDPSASSSVSDLDEFRSCCSDLEEWSDALDDNFEEKSEQKETISILESYCKMFFKGLSEFAGESGQRNSGIGVVIKGEDGRNLVQVQKRLDFFVDASLVEHLALMDGILAALESGVVKRVQAFTDSDVVYDQIARGLKLENQLLLALRQRILVHVRKLDDFVLTLIPSGEVSNAKILAKEAIDKMVTSLRRAELRRPSVLVLCSICCEENPPEDMVTVRCLHTFCRHCMERYVESKMQASQVPIRCPQVDCDHHISPEECKAFLPSSCYDTLLKTLAEANVPESKRVYCPFPDCSAMFDNGQDESIRASSSNHLEDSKLRCVECPECHRLFCAECAVPWHSSMTCEEYQSLPADERNSDDVTLHRLAQNRRWRRCQECRRMIELTQGCFHMTCWCGHEFCYACGAEYRNKQQTCQCAYWDEHNIINPPRPNELSDWTYFNQYFYNGADHEQSQLALLQRFLSEDFMFNNNLQTPSRSNHHEQPLENTIDDLHQVPFLGSFVSAISDTSYEHFPYG